LTRPWYTFDVSDYQNIAIQNVGPLPSEEGGQEFVVPPLVNEMGEIVEEAPPKSHVLDIGDCGGAAKLDYGGWNFTLEDVIDGTIVFSGLTESITTIDVLLMKIEQGDDESNESIVHELSVLAPKFAAEDAAKIEESDVDVPKAVGEPITGDVQIPVKLELKDLDITPTYIHAGNKEGDADDLINVRYYLRLRLANSSGGLFWNTNEVFFFQEGFERDDPDRCVRSGLPRCPECDVAPAVLSFTLSLSFCPPPPTLIPSSIRMRAIKNASHVRKFGRWRALKSDSFTQLQYDM